MSRKSRKQVSFEQVLEALLDMNQPFPARFLHRFSDLSPEDLESLKRVWKQVPVERRAALMEDLEMLAEADTLVSFDELSKFALDDEDPRVRAGALSLLWECQDPHLIHKMIQMMEEDSDEIVRAQAASVLAQFVYLGEVEELPETTLHMVEDHLLSALSRDRSPLVQRRALEALGFSSRQEVPSLILRAYTSDDPAWVASALFAMGRSADPAWGQHVVRMLDHPDFDVQLEAVRAAGELEIEEAREPLLNMLEEGIEDEEVRMAAIWSLSQIGGEGVQQALERLLAETEDDDEATFIEDALDNLSFNEGVMPFGMFEFEVQDEKDLDHIIDLASAEEDEEEDLDEDLLARLN
ncbi:HEAT repeat domain-containing protein [uncultured Thermanaerothrix sp.]|uniref:HEAT repeat domain-containing protein n=1 Tax=uncultured Thermanaerothrix sp. TaxID=1195149 RepID=UPI002632792A|nr:HEAT repeat domain-containing protein [uncultured Thermanaerothrix sp.]